MDWSIQIMGGSFRQGLNSDVVISTGLTVQPLPLYNSNGDRARWQPAIWLARIALLLYSVQLYSKYGKFFMVDDI